LFIFLAIHIAQLENYRAETKLQLYNRILIDVLLNNTTSRIDDQRRELRAESRLSLGVSFVRIGLNAGESRLGTLCDA